MASLMVRIKGVGQKPIRFDSKGRPVVPKGFTSFFVLSRVNGKRAQIGDSYKTLQLPWQRGLRLRRKKPATS